MTRIVLDTNVWVAGLLAPSGPPARIIDLVFNGTFVLVVSPTILREYEEVLTRPELALPAAEVRSALAYLKIPGTHVVHVDPAGLPGVCSDPDDDCFIAAALAGHADAVITGNTRHFPVSPWRGIVIATPVGFFRSFSALEQ